LQLGYEAALSTTELLLRYNPALRSVTSFGLHRTHFLGGGLPIIPRIRLGPDWRNEVLLAALLHQPLVVVGHHGDMANDHEILLEIAAVVNRLPGTTWQSPAQLARENYVSSIHGGTMMITTYSRRFYTSVPAGIDEIAVNRPWFGDEGLTETLIVRDSRGAELARVNGGRTVRPIPISGPCRIEIINSPLDPMDYRTVPAPRCRGWPVARKIMMEARDRSAPWRRAALRLLQPGQTAHRTPASR
jgi:hypothetical protein